MRSITIDFSQSIERKEITLGFELFEELVWVKSFEGLEFLGMKAKGSIWTVRHNIRYTNAEGETIQASAPIRKVGWLGRRKIIRIWKDPSPDAASCLICHPRP